MPSANESITIRIDKKLLRRLRAISVEKRTSINVLCNQILSQYEKWHAHASAAGMRYYSQEFIQMVLEDTPDDKVTSIAEKIAFSAKGKILALRGEFTLEAFLDAFTAWLQASSIEYRHEVEDDNHIFVVIHNTGRKWSVFLSEFLRVTLNQFEIRSAYFDYTDTTLVFKLNASK